MKNFFLGFVFSLFFVFTSASALNNGSIGSLFENIVGEGWKFVGEHIQDGTVTSNRIKDETLTGGDIKDGSIKSEDIQDGTIGSDDIAGSTIKNSHILDASLDGRNIDLSTLEVSGDNISADTITGTKIRDGTISHTKVDGRYIQKRIIGECTKGIKSIASNGTVTCGDSPYSHYGYPFCSRSYKGRYRLESDGTLKRCNGSRSVVITYYP